MRWNGKVRRLISNHQKAKFRYHKANDMDVFCSFSYQACNMYKTDKARVSYSLWTFFIFIWPKDNLCLDLSLQGQVYNGLLFHKMMPSFFVQHKSNRHNSSVKASQITGEIYGFGVPFRALRPCVSLYLFLALILYAC